MNAMKITNTLLIASVLSTIAIANIGCARVQGAAATSET